MTCAQTAAHYGATGELWAVHHLRKVVARYGEAAAVAHRILWVWPVIPANGLPAEVIAGLQLDATLHADFQYRSLHQGATRGEAVHGEVVVRAGVFLDVAVRFALVRCVSDHCDLAQDVMAPNAVVEGVERAVVLVAELEGVMPEQLAAFSLAGQQAVRYAP